MHSLGVNLQGWTCCDVRVIYIMHYVPISLLVIYILHYVPISQACPIHYEDMLG